MRRAERRMAVFEQYKRTVEQVEQVCKNAGRDPQKLTLLAVSKTVGLPQIDEAARAGAQFFGENRPDELMEKHDARPELSWHMIGNIQSRRIRDIVGRADLIHSLYKKEHAIKIDERARELGIVQDVLIEVNVSGEESKSGLAPLEVKGFLDICTELPNVRVCGLMTMAPRSDEIATRASFEGLRELGEQLKETLPDKQANEFNELSMGMSEDWPIAIEEGATIVRIGRAIFSEEFA